MDANEPERWDIIQDLGVANESQTELRLFISDTLEVITQTKHLPVDQVNVVVAVKRSYAPGIAGGAGSLVRGHQ